MYATTVLTRKFRVPVTHTPSHLCFFHELHQPCFGEALLFRLPFHWRGCQCQTRLFRRWRGRYIVIDHDNFGLDWNGARGGNWRCQFHRLHRVLFRVAAMFTEKTCNRFTRHVFVSLLFDGGRLCPVSKRQVGRVQERQVSSHPMT